MTTIGQFRPIEITPGVNTAEDNTPMSTTQWTMSDKIRFNNGFAQKIGGWSSITYTAEYPIIGKVRTIFGTVLNDVTYAVIGTNARVYSLFRATLTNITPLNTDTTAISNSLATDYSDLATDPFTMQNASTTVTVATTRAARYKTGDPFTISGVSGTIHGVPMANLNAQHSIRTVGAGFVTIKVATAATSSGTGGGSSVVFASGLLNITATANGLTDGTRVKITGAADTGGIEDSEINQEFIIRNTATDTYDVFTQGTATSSVTAGGGTDTLFQSEILPGPEDEIAGQGYGMGSYGTGLYGSVKVSSTSRRYPRTWFMDRFGNLVVMTPGNQGGLYQWDGTTTSAPTLIENAPDNSNYCFVSDNILLTFGEDGVENRVTGSDQGDQTNWTSSSSNQVFRDDIEGAGRLITSANAAGVNILFTSNKCYTFRYIGPPLVWQIQELDPTIGIISPMARVSVKGMIFWMGQENFYFWRGGNAEIIPANTQGESTILNYVFNNMTASQRSKCFGWYNYIYDEVWFHYCSGSALNPDRLARVSLKDFTWCPDTMDRTAAEYPNAALQYPRLADSNSTLFYHEISNDADGSPLPWSLTGPLMKNNGGITATMSVIPDSFQTGNISCTINAKLYPQSASSTFLKTYTVTPTTEQITTRISGRVWQYSLSGSALGQVWRYGQWYEEIQPQGVK